MSAMRSITCAIGITVVLIAACGDDALSTDAGAPPSGGTQGHAGAAGNQSDGGAAGSGGSTAGAGGVGGGASGTGGEIDAGMEPGPCFDPANVSVTCSAISRGEVLRHPARAVDTSASNAVGQRSISWARCELLAIGGFGVLALVGTELRAVRISEPMAGMPLPQLKSFALSWPGSGAFEAVDIVAPQRTDMALGIDFAVLLCSPEACVLQGADTARDAALAPLPGAEVPAWLKPF